MTRFWINLEMAVEFVLSTYGTKKTHDKVLVPPFMKSAKVLDVVDCLSELMGISDYKTEVIGVRLGEKLHECLTSVHSSIHVSSENCSKFTRGELLGILRPFVKTDKPKTLNLVRLNDETTADSRI